MITFDKGGTLFYCFNPNISYFSDASTPSTTTGSPVPEATSSSSETDESKLSLAAALEHPASTASTTNSNGSNLNESGIETDLRKSLVKSRLGQVTECQLTEVRLPRSDSIDSMLGDSLLDPPQVIIHSKKCFVNSLTHVLKVVEFLISGFLCT